MAKEPANPLAGDDWEEISTGIGEEWDFDKSGQLIGTYKGTEYVDIPVERQIDGRTRAMTYQFETASEGATVFCWESYQLTEAMKEVSIGDLCRIQFDGYKKFDSAAGPRQVKQFRVSVKRS